MTSSESSASNRQTARKSAVLETRAASSLLFEIAWEVCAQVGGIYTVLRSKAPATAQRWRDAYCLIGPYRENTARIELEPQLPSGPIKATIDDLSHRGIH
ncbi:MAG: hypothetical protein JXO22_10050, partial [Phycisphaerae bacterium]|nr:hypothetical protein [Phycisphaerae bacterium]